MNSKKIVFLDIDGVLNTRKHQRIIYKDYQQGDGKSRDKYGVLFDPEAVKNLEQLCRETGAKIVVSSTWRKNGLKTMFDLFKFRNIDVQVIDITPDLTRQVPCGLYVSTIRGDEIALWLHENQVDAYVILDDMDDMQPEQFLNFVQTKGEDGFNDSCLQKAIDILTKSPAQN